MGGSSARMALALEHECWEGSQILLASGAEIVCAWYGKPAQRWQVDRGGVDCTRVVVKRHQAERAICASNRCLLCDPAPGVRKVLLIELREPAAGEIEPIPVVPLFPIVEETSSFPLWLAFVRHAQAGHNVDNELLHRPDNPLTERGEEQALNARDGPAGLTLRSADLVITSPLLRAMQTTALLLGPDNAGVRIMVHAKATERWSAPCDEGTSKTELLEVVSDQIREWEGWDAVPEQWWAQDGEDWWVRAEEFKTFLQERPEARIACVGHGGFWDVLLGKHLGNCQHVCCDRFFGRVV